MTLIDDDDEILFRQVNPQFIQSNAPSRQAFSPFPKDKGEVSVDRSIDLSPRQSFENFKSLGLASQGVWAVTQGECRSGPVPVPCYASPLSTNPHHAHIDFNGLSKGQIKKKAKQLTQAAISRGRLYP